MWVGKEWLIPHLYNVYITKKSKALSRYRQLPVPFTNHLRHISEKHKYMVNTNKQNADFK